MCQIGNRKKNPLTRLHIESFLSFCHHRHTVGLLLAAKAEFHRLPWTSVPTGMAGGGRKTVFLIVLCHLFSPHGVSFLIPLLTRSSGLDHFSISYCNDTRSLSFFKRRQRSQHSSHQRVRFSPRSQYCFQETGGIQAQTIKTAWCKCEADRYATLKHNRLFTAMTFGPVSFL